MSGCPIGSVQSNWCQTNLVSFNSKTIDFVSHLDSSKAFHSISSHFLVYKLRKHSLDENTRGWMQNCLKNYSESCQRFKIEDIKNLSLIGGLLRSGISHYEWQINYCTY